MNVLLILCAMIVSTSGMFPLHKNHAAASMKTPSQLTLFTSMLTGFMLLAYDFFLVYDISADNWTALRPLFGHAPTGSVTLASATFTMLLTSVAKTIFAAFYADRVAIDKRGSDLLSCCVTYQLSSCS
jgi:high-affinity Fe2+/Pb2+ permease